MELHDIYNMLKSTQKIKTQHEHDFFSFSVSVYVFSFKVLVLATLCIMSNGSLRPATKPKLMLLMDKLGIYGVAKIYTCKTITKI